MEQYDFVPLDNGAKEAAKSVHADTEVSSATSHRKGKRNIGKGESLEILQSALAQCVKAGIDCRYTKLYSHGRRQLAIILDGVQLMDGDLKESNDPPHN